MESRAKLLGHPIHQMLIVLPLGLLSGAAIFDVVYLFTDSGRFADIAFWLIGVGILTGVVAAVFGLVDWAAIPHNTRAKRIGLLHGVGNLVVIALFVVTWVLRRDDAQNPSPAAIVLCLVAVGLAAVTGWLGGELVDRLGVGVDDGAHLNAPSSLTHRTTTTHDRP